MQRVSSGNPSQSVGSERKPGENLSRDGRQPEPLEDFPCHFRSDKNDEELRQQLFGTAGDGGCHGASII